MLEEIYPRLLSQILPEQTRLSDLDIRRMLDERQTGEDFNRAYGQFVKSIYDDNPSSNIGLELGTYLLPSKLCDFSRVLVTAPKVSDTLTLVERMHYIQGACYQPFISRLNGKVRISLVYPYRSVPPITQRRFCAETAFSYIVNGIRETISPDFKPTLLYLDYPAPGYAEQYQERFGTNIKFGQHLNMIEFDEKYLELSLNTHNDALHSMYLNKYLDFARACDRSTSFEYKAISHLMVHHPETLNAQQLAERLNISVRGLQKRLSKTGQSFSCISNRCRRELAKIYLVQEQQSVDFTAEKLGFQTSSGFRRFFRNEFGQSPIEYLSGEPHTHDTFSSESNEGAYDPVSPTKRMTDKACSLSEA